jgi:hypothetical protein
LEEKLNGGKEMVEKLKFLVSFNLSKICIENSYNLFLNPQKITTMGGLFQERF